MKFRRYTIIILLVMCAIPGLAGCSGYGRLRPASGQVTGISIQHLEGFSLFIGIAHPLQISGVSLEAK
jgi:hypothetical protein